MADPPADVAERLPRDVGEPSAAAVPLARLEPLPVPRSGSSSDRTDVRAYVVHGRQV